MGNPPQMEPPESAIEDMWSRLAEDGEGKKRGLAFPVWWPFLLTIPFVLGGLFFFQKYQSLNQNFELKDEAIGNRYPITIPDGPLDVLHELKGRFSYLQIPIELKKEFRGGKIFQPYLHFGFSAVRPLTQNFTYEYINALGEYKKTQNFKSGAFTISNLRAGFGGEFTFSEKYTVGFGAYYQHGLEVGEGEYFKLRYWGLQAGMQYQLF